MQMVGFIHPGAMGVTLAAACSAPTGYASQGRSQATLVRAASASIVDLGTLDALVAGSEIVISICPPAAADDVASQVQQLGFGGVYVDANAVNPSVAHAIAERFEHFVDGSVIGPPATQPGTTRLYLSGERAGVVASLYEASAVDARVLDGGVGAASAIKMAYAANTKIGAALLLAIRALARRHDVDEALVAEWELSQPGLVERVDRTAGRVAPKAWRFEGEMHEIAATFASAGLPAGFGEAAGELYARLGDFRNVDDADLAAVVEQLLAT